MALDALAVAMFEANARNGGNAPAEHFDRSAGIQWMRLALTECGVADLIEAAQAVIRSTGRDGVFIPSISETDALRAAVARLGDGA